MGRFSKKNIPLLKYSVIHAQFGREDGVSIVMDQVEEVMIKELNIPKTNISYLVGRSGRKDSRVTVNKKLWIDDPENVFMRSFYNKGFGGDLSERVEKAIREVQSIIESFIVKNSPDVIIAHNTCHPVNFLLSVALHRFYRDAVLQKKKTPKYVLWWHDSHAERAALSTPAPDVKQYLLQGVPGPFVEYIMFINSLQFFQAEKYFEALDKENPGYLELARKNHSVMYNTTNTFIDSFDDLVSDKFSEKVETFIDEFKIKSLLDKTSCSLQEMLFCLQHTRVLDRKRIDFALEYAFALFEKVQQDKEYNKKAFYFLVSGHSADDTKRALKKQYRKLCKQYDTKNFFLVFAEEVSSSLRFEDFPLIVGKLKGFSTYFSEVEGFGNNLLEVLASGLVPVVYTYPVFKADIAKHKFKVIALDEFTVTDKSLAQVIDVLARDRKRQLWVNHNLAVLRKKFPHKLIAVKLQRAIIRRRTHE